MRKRIWITGSLLLAMLLALPIAAGAEDEPPIVVETSVECDSVNFAFVIQDDFAPYKGTLDFGDTEVTEEFNMPAGSFALPEPHFYPHGGDFVWILTTTDAQGDVGTTTGTVTID
jgi:hypothetical protein